MTIGRVIGSLVSTIKHRTYDGTKLLLVKPVNMDGDEIGPAMVAVDAIGAGAGELVLLIREGNAARVVLGVDYAPVRSIIVGIVDKAEVAGKPALTH